MCTIAALESRLVISLFDEQAAQSVNQRYANSIDQYAGKYNRNSSPATPQLELRLSLVILLPVGTRYQIFEMSYLDKRNSLAFA